MEYFVQNYALDSVTKAALFIKYKIEDYRSELLRRNLYKSHATIKKLKKKKKTKNPNKNNNDLKHKHH